MNAYKQFIKKMKEVGKFETAVLCRNLHVHPDSQDAGACNNRHAEMRTLQLIFKRSKYKQGKK